ncbi:PAP2 superfamily-domain-containing protein [Lipomyces japonicus]|uniref:PAP2 superfamily-domain-containing protein n=1 Tax=Lipomyces japonicus TaxID=56871 RepID=UPI0034CE7CF3
MSTTLSALGDLANSESSPVNLSSLAFTHVHYDPDDLFSQCQAYISLVPQAMCVMYGTLIISRREAETIMLLGGQVLSEIANLILKQLFKEERPSYEQHGIANELGYGMPSAHAQFMAFFTTYVTLWMYFRARHFSRRKRLLRLIFLLTLSGLVCYSRIYLYYHSVKQVLVGAVVGVVLGSGWLLVTATIREIGLLDYILDWGIVKWFYIKDTSQYRSYIRDEYYQWSIGRKSFLGYDSNSSYYKKERKWR